VTRRLRKVARWAALVALLAGISLAGIAAGDWLLCEHRTAPGAPLADTCAALVDMCADPWAWFMFGAIAASTAAIGARLVLHGRRARVMQSHQAEHRRLASEAADNG